MKRAEVEETRRIKARREERREKVGRCIVVIDRGWGFARWGAREEGCREEHSSFCEIAR